MELKIGDKFTNTKGSVCNIVNIHTYGRKAEVSSSNWQSNSHYSVEYIVNKIRSGIYKDYISVSEIKKYEVGGTFLTDFGNTYKILQISDSLLRAICINGSYKDKIDHWSFNSIRTFPYTPPTSNNPDMSRTWKKEDFYNVHISIKNVNESIKIQNFLFSIGITWKSGSIITKYTDQKKLQISKQGQMYIDFEFYGREITYEEIFNNQSITTTNENNSKNTNDLSSTHFTGNRREETATAIAFSKTSRIASSSRYIGNTVKGRSTPTRIGRSEIKFQAVTT